MFSPLGEESCSCGCANPSIGIFNCMMYILCVQARMIFNGSVLTGGIAMGLDHCVVAWGRSKWWLPPGITELQRSFFARNRVEGRPQKLAPLEVCQITSIVNVKFARKCHTPCQRVRVTLNLQVNAFLVAVVVNAWGNVEEHGSSQSSSRHYLT